MLSKFPAQEYSGRWVVFLYQFIHPEKVDHIIHRLFEAPGVPGPQDVISLYLLLENHGSWYNNADDKQKCHRSNWQSSAFQKVDPNSPIEPPGYNFIEDCRVKDRGFKDYGILVPLNYYIGLNKKEKDIYFPSCLTLLVKNQAYR